jgi:hypothetical protein
MTDLHQELLDLATRIESEELIASESSREIRQLIAKYYAIEEVIAGDWTAR